MQLKQQTSVKIRCEVAIERKAGSPPTQRKGAELRFNKRESVDKLHSYSTGDVQSFMRLSSLKILYIALFLCKFFHIGGQKFAGNQDKRI